jgi:diaminopimelate epimerase
MRAFRKYHCFGRDFILLDNRDGAFGTLRSVDAARFCDRRFGIGASGILRLDAVNKSQIKVAAYNFNGVLAEFNAVDAACVAAFAKDLGVSIPMADIIVNKQKVCCKIASSHENMHVVNICLPEPVVIKKFFSNFIMMCGGAFCMVPIDEVSNVNVLAKGRELAHHKRFPKGANVTFYQPSPSHLDIRHYEHHVDKETYTNGLCVIGAALSHAQNNPNTSCCVRTKGGEMQVSFARAQRTFYDVELRVLVNAVFKGEI